MKTNMQHVSRDELLEKVPSVYKLVILATKRTFDLNEGAPRFIEEKMDKASQTALIEIREGLVGYKEN